MGSLETLRNGEKESKWQFSLTAKKGAEPVTTGEVQQCKHREVFRTGRERKNNPLSLNSKN